MEDTKDTDKIRELEAQLRSAEQTIAALQSGLLAIAEYADLSVYDDGSMGARLRHLATNATSISDPALLQAEERGRMQVARMLRDRAESLEETFLDTHRAEIAWLCTAADAIESGRGVRK